MDGRTRCQELLRSAIPERNLLTRLFGAWSPRTAPEHDSPTEAHWGVVATNSSGARCPTEARWSVVATNSSGAQLTIKLIGAGSPRAAPERECPRGSLELRTEPGAVR
eukprot:6471216-Alexandrium_andersonii.AAC.1